MKNLLALQRDFQKLFCSTTEIIMPHSDQAEELIGFKENKKQEWMSESIWKQIEE